MVDIVTKDQAKAHLYIDDDSHDAWLDIFIPAVSDAILLWVKVEDKLYVDPAANPKVVRPAVVASALIELASLFRYREGEGDNRVESAEGYGYVLSKTSTALLTPLRKSTVA